MTTRFDLLNKRVHKSLSDYIGFDINILLNQGDPLIFGGAIRDSICGDKINDLDIIVGGQTFIKLKTFLENRNFEQVIDDDFIEELYYELQAVFVPISFMKDDAKIQLIRPKAPQYIEDNCFFDDKYKNIFYKEFINFAGEVDLSCCGVAYDINNKVIETYEGAISDCIRKEFRVLEDNKMHLPNRINERIDKMVSRNWIEYADR